MEARSGGRLLLPALTIALCALYLLLAAGLSLLAGRAYQATAQQADELYLPRTALSYLVNQVRRGDAADSLRVTSFGGSDALALEEDGYVTLLYCWDGWLRELYAQADLTFAPEDGTQILPMDQLDIGMEGGLLTFTIRGDGAQYSISAAPRCPTEGGRAP